MTDTVGEKLVVVSEIYSTRDVMSSLKIDTRAIDNVISSVFDPNAPAIDNWRLSRARVLLDIRLMLGKNTKDIDRTIACTFDAGLSPLGENTIERARRLLELKERMERDRISTLATTNALLNLFKVTNNVATAIDPC